MRARVGELVEEDEGESVGGLEAGRLARRSGYKFKGALGAGCDGSLVLVVQVLMSLVGGGGGLAK